MASKSPIVPTLVRGLAIFLSASALYLYVFPQTNLFYAAVVLAHTGAGALAAVLLLPFLRRSLREQSLMGRVGCVLFLAAAVLGVILIYTGTSRPQWNWLYAHMVVSVAAAAFLIAAAIGRRG